MAVSGFMNMEEKSRFTSARFTHLAVTARSSDRNLGLNNLTRMRRDGLLRSKLKG